MCDLAVRWGMRSFFVIAVLWVTHMAWSAGASELKLPPGAFENPDQLAEAMPAFARAVLAKLPAKPSDDAGLDDRFRLQAVAGDSDGALQSLALLRKLREPAGVAAVVPFEISIMAGPNAAGADLVAEAFRSVFAKLDDPTAALAIRALRTDAGQIERALQSELEALKGSAAIAVGDATALVRAFGAAQSFRRLAGLPSTAIAEDDQRRYVIEADLAIKAADGAIVCAFVVRPRAARAALTALLEFTIYTDVANNMVGARLSASHGYAGVVGYTRGKACSPGAPMPYEHDGADAASLIDWVSRQSWSDGRVGMFGGSYSGFTAWAAAKKRPKALKAILVGSPVAPAIDVPMEGNVFWSFVYPWPFFTTNNKTLDQKTYNDNDRWYGLSRKFYAEGRAYRDLDKIDGTPNPIFRKWLAHPGYDRYWQAMIPYRVEYAAIDIPVLQTAGYYYGGPGGAPYYFDQHLTYRPQAEHYLVIGPYDHVQAQRGTINALGERSEFFAGYQLDPIAQIDFVDLRYRWFDFVFRGAPKPSLLKDRVNYQLMAANVWRHAPSFAGMATTRKRLYFSATRQGDGHALADAAGGIEESVRLEVDLKDRRDIDEGGPGGIESDAVDKRNAVIFTSQPLDADADGAGLFEAHLDFVTNKKDFDVSISLYELTAKGSYVLLAPYTGRLSYAIGDGRRQLLKPGKRTRVDVKALRPMGRRLAKGSRLVVVLGLIKNAGQQINYGSGKDVSDETIADAGAPVRIDWYSSSFVEIPLTP